MEIITFEQIFELVRNEKTKEEICEVDENIVRKIQDYLLTKEQIYQDSKGKIIEPELEKIKTQIASARSLAREFYDRREKKVVMLALNKSRVGEVDTSRLLLHEKAIFEQMTQFLQKHRYEILDGMLNPKMQKNTSDSQSSYSNDGSAESQELSETKSSSENLKTSRIEEKISEELITVKFIEDQHKFYGPNLEIFGPFKPGDIANLPKIIVDILIKKEKVVLLNLK